MNEKRRLLDGKEFMTLPCGHEAVDASNLEIACPTCRKVFLRVGLRLEAPERWHLQEAPKKRILI